jgi:transaldolase/glucose-6-phosphate isomerase
MSARLSLALPAPAEARMEALLDTAWRERWAARLFERDASLWSSDPDVQESIAQRLGWLDAPGHFSDQIDLLEAFGDGIREAGFDTAVVMGMGGSSLAPDVLNRTFGTAPDYLQLRVLDSTDPAAVAAVVDDLDPLETLWIVSSKSGTTTEPMAFLADAWDRVRRALHERGSDQYPGEFFVAITDPGRSVEAIPHHDGLREVFLNPPDIGGRYAALTYVGLVPASLIGLDLDPLLEAAIAMLDACRESEPAENPGLRLGLALGALARAGHDKMTFLSDPALVSFEAWAEQLVAESTGKHGVGIVPVDLEPARSAAAYGPDRAFVVLTQADGDDPASSTTGGGTLSGLAADLEAAGHPVIRIELDDPIDLAGEFVRWEVATAIAGAVLGIDPFDQPNVEEAKERTRRLLAEAGRAGDAATTLDRGTLRVSDAGDEALAMAIRTVVGDRRAPESLAIQAFIAPSPEVDDAIARVRAALGATGCAITAGYGPRFLHSTGQLHKGGPPNGTFLQLTADHPADRPIPGWPYTFGRLIDAQARGDREALRAHDRPVAHVHLGADLAGDIGILERAIRSALG